MVSRTKLLRFTTSHSQCSRILSTLSPNHLQGSYVAVSGTPGRGSVHVVEGVPALVGGSVTVVNGVRVCFSKIFYNIYDSYFIIFHDCFSQCPTTVDPMWPQYPIILCRRWIFILQHGFTICCYLLWISVCF